MPEMDGYELVKRIRTEEDGHAYLPIIALSANALQGEGERCRQLGMDDYLTKPASLAELQSAIERWLPKEVTLVSVDIKAEPNPNVTTTGAVEIAAVDLAVLKNMVGAEEAVVTEFIYAFEQDLEQLAEHLCEAFKRGSLPELISVAHKLKSSTRSVGALVLGNICADIEQAAKQNHTQALTILLLNFERELNRVEKFLKEY